MLWKIHQLLASERVLSGEENGKLCIAADAHMRYIYMQYVHNPESAQKISRTWLKKGNSALETRHRYTDSSTMKKMAADLKAKRKKPVTTHGPLG